MAGYSGTPLPRRLGIKPGFRVALLSMPDDVKSELQPALADCEIANSKPDPLDFAMLFVESQAALKKGFPAVASQLAPAGMFWVSWPKKASGIKTDLTEDTVRKIGLAAGLVDVKVCAVNETWSGLKFVIRLKDRK